MYACFFFILIFQVAAGQDVCNAILYPRGAKHIEFWGSRHQYQCQGWNTEDNVTVHWYINETLLTSRNFENINLIPKSGITSLLQIQIYSKQLNNTEFYCTVKYPTTQCNSTKSVLIVQGRLSAISNVKTEFNFTCLNGTISLNWLPPFSLNASDAHQSNDIAYTIEVNDQQGNIVNTTTLENSLTTTIPDYTFHMANCDLYNITILPSNAVGPGRLLSIARAPHETEPVVLSVLKGIYIDEHHYQYLLHSKPAICDIHKVNLIDIYEDQDEIIIPEENIHVLPDCNSTTMVVLNVISNNITKGRRYRAEYILPHSQEMTPSNNLSTHDIQDIFFAENHNYMSVTFLENSTSNGCLLHFQSQDRNQSLFVYIDKHVSQYYSINPSDPNCTMVAFDVESNGYLREGTSYPATFPITLSHQIGNSSVDNLVENCLQPKQNEFMVKSDCICSKLYFEKIYQFILVNSSDVIGQTYSAMKNCTLDFDISLDYDVTYFMAFYEHNEDEDTMFLPTVTVSLASLAKPTNTTHTEPNHEIVTRNTKKKTYIIIGAGVAVIFILIVSAVITAPIAAKWCTKRKIWWTNHTIKVVDNNSSSNLNADYQQREDS